MKVLIPIFYILLVVHGTETWNEERNCFFESGECTRCKEKDCMNPYNFPQQYLKKMMVDPGSSATEAVAKNTRCVTYTKDSEYIMDYENHLIYQQCKIYIYIYISLHFQWYCLPFSYMYVL